MTLPAYSMSSASFPALYERFLVTALFRPWAEDLLERAVLAPPDRVLDVACGTGIVARLAKARLGPQSVVVGVDSSAPMLAVASEREPAVDWRVGDAAALPITGVEQFDLVVCQQGMQFFADRAAAAREMYRVLAPGGRALLATWRSLEEHPILLALQHAAERYVAPYVDQRYALADGAELKRLLEAAGFSSVQVEAVSRTHAFDDPAAFLRLNTMAIIGMSGTAADAADAERQRLVDVIVRQSEPALAPYLRDGRLSFATASNVAIGFVAR